MRGAQGTAVQPPAGSIGHPTVVGIAHQGGLGWRGHLSRARAERVASSRTMASTLTVVTAAELSNSDLERESELRSAVYAETHPDDLAIPATTFALTVRGDTMRAQHHGLIEAGADLLAYGILSHVPGEPLADVEIGVRGDARCRGHATALARRLIDLAPADVRVLRAMSTSASDAAEPFARSLGASLAQREHVNALDLTTVDRERFRRWVEESAAAEPEYALDVIDGVWPADRAAALCELFAVLADAPTDDMQAAPATSVAPEAMRAQLQAAVDAGYSMWTAVVTHRPSGAPVALHQITFRADQPAQVWVPNTVVARQHRGHHLGRWMKADVTLRVLDTLPAARRMETKNADSNAAVLRLNQELGYRPLRATVTWQLVLR